MSGLVSDAIVGDLPKKKVDTSLSIVRQETTRMISILAYNGKMEHTEEVLSMNVQKQEQIYRAESHARLGPMKQNPNIAVNQSMIPYSRNGLGATSIQGNASLPNPVLTCCFQSAISICSRSLFSIKSS